MESAFWFFFLLKLKSKIKALVLISLVVLALLVAFPNEIRDIFTTVNVQLNILGDYLSQTESSSISVRLNLVKNALGILIKSFGFGVGAGNVKYYMTKFPVYATYGLVNVHNWWIEVLASYGLFIFTGYVVFYLSLLLDFCKVYSKLENGTEKMLGEALLVGLVGFFAASISSSSIMTLKPQWMFFAFALAFLNYLRARRKIK